MFILFTILVFLLILTVLVIIHEAGHYFTAKYFGIKVEEFGFGFPPKAFSIKKGETVYSINWLPIGGFVKLYGEDEAGGGSVKLSPNEKVKDEKRAFYARPVWQRAVVVVAGVVMNMLLAMVLFYVFFFFSNFSTVLPKIGNYTFFGANQRIMEEGIIVSNVAPNSPAAKIDLKPKSRIVSINGKKLASQKQMLDIITKNKGKAVSLTWENVGTKKTITKNIIPRVNPPKNEGSLGIQFEYSPVALMIISYDTPQQKLLSGAVHAINIMPWQLDAIGSLINKSMKENDAKPVSEAVSGPVGIGFAVGSILQIPNAKVAALQLLNLAAIMSAALAFFNVLPIPALDGGRLFFILIEGITRRKVNQKVEGMIHTVGFVVLLGFILLITFQDISRFILPYFFK